MLLAGKGIAARAGVSTIGRNRVAHQPEPSVKHLPGSHSPSLAAHFNFSSTFSRASRVCAIDPKREKYLWPGPLLVGPGGFEPPTS
jgi:hypothetical protein